MTGTRTRTRTRSETGDTDGNNDDDRDRDTDRDTDTVTVRDTDRDTTLSWTWTPHKFMWMGLITQGNLFRGKLYSAEICLQMYDTLWPVYDPAESSQKYMRAYQSNLLDTLKKIFTCKNGTSRNQKDPCLKSPLAQKFIVVPRGIRPNRNS
jgi:hypothetical protein